MNTLPASSLLESMVAMTLLTIAFSVMTRTEKYQSAYMQVSLLPGIYRMLNDPLEADSLQSKPFSTEVETTDYKNLNEYKISISDKYNHEIFTLEFLLPDSAKVGLKGIYPPGVDPLALYILNRSCGKPSMGSMALSELCKNDRRL
jgi:hypothetical protein